MSKRVNLPPGCSGFDAADGTRYSAQRPGGTVVVSDRHAAAIDGGQYGQTGFITGKEPASFGTKRGMECPRCHRVWNAWNDACPRCSTEAEPVATVPWDGGPTPNGPLGW